VTGGTVFGRPRAALRLPIVARMFNGQRLFLVDYKRADSALCCWSSDQSKAHVFGSTSAALGAAAFAALFWHADCGVIDGDGTVLQPAEAREFAREPVGVARVKEFPVVLTAAPRESVPRIECARCGQQFEPDTGPCGCGFRAETVR